MEKKIVLRYKAKIKYYLRHETKANAIIIINDFDEYQTAFRDFGHLCSLVATILN